MSTILQRLLLAIGILEIPLQVDSYLFYQLEDAQFGSVGGLNISLLTFTLAALYVLWMIEVALRPKPSCQSIVWGVPLLFYLSVVALSAIGAEKPPLTLYELMLMVQAYLLFFYVANRMQSRSDVVFVVSMLTVMESLNLSDISSCSSTERRPSGSRFMKLYSHFR